MIKKGVALVAFAIAAVGAAVYLAPERPAFGPPSISPDVTQHFDPFSVELSGEAGAEIRYTLDGSEPSSSSKAYSAPIEIDRVGLVVVRAATFGLRRARSQVTEMVYLSWTGVARQKAPPKAPATWGSVAASYDVDPARAVDPKQIALAISRNAIVDLTLSDEDAFGPKGILAVKDGTRSCRAAIALPSGAFGSGACRVSGLDRPGERSEDPKPSLSLSILPGGFGDRVLPGPYRREDGMLILDAGRTAKVTIPDPKQRNQASYTSTIIFDRIFGALGNQAPDHIPAQLFLNGLYWGMFDLREGVDTSFLARRFGGDPSDFEVTCPPTPTPWIAEIVDKANKGFAELDAAFDLQSLADFYLVSTFLGARDVPRGGFCLARSKKGKKLAKTTVIPLGAESSSAALYMASQPPEVVPGSLTDVFAAAAAHETFRVLLADRMQLLLGAQAMLNRADATSIYYRIAKDQEVGIRLELSRWGSLFSKAVPVTPTLVSSAVTFEAQAIPHRVSATRAYFAGYVLPLLAPELQTQQGQRGQPVPLLHANPTGVIEARMDGLDPRDPLTGKPRPDNEQAPFGPAPRASGILAARVFESETGKWSPLLRVPYVVSNGPPSLRISEVYQKPAPGHVTFAELENIGPYPISLRGFTLQNVAALALEVPPGGRFVITEDRTRFAKLHPEVPVAAEIPALAESGDVIALGPGGRGEAIFSYSASNSPGRSWIPGARQNESLESAALGGSPGSRDPNEPSWDQIRTAQAEAERAADPESSAMDEAPAPREEDPPTHQPPGPPGRNPPRTE